MHDFDLLVRDKYDGDASRVTDEDRTKLATGVPLAYIIGWVPFLGLRVALDSKPLIPRPETEWWAQLLTEKIGERSCRVLDLCAGSGAVGLSVLKHCPNASVHFGELVPHHSELIRENISLNAIDDSRAEIRTGDLFAPFTGELFDVIAANPPYIPDGRDLDSSVLDHEPHEALFAGEDGLALIRRIAEDAPNHITEYGQLWLECDTAHATEAALILQKSGARSTDVLPDVYGRDRLVLAYY